MALLKPAANAEASRWLTERLTDFGTDVLGIVPSGFEAYARVFHPAEQVTAVSSNPINWAAEPIRWAQVAARTGRTAHGAMQWASLRGTFAFIESETTLKAGDVWVRGPEIGCLPLEVARALEPPLGRYTQTRSYCFFAVWEGFGCLPRTILEVPKFDIPARSFYLFTGPLEAIEKTFCTGEIENALSGGVMVAILTGSEDPLDAENTERFGKIAQAMNQDILIGSDEPNAEELKAALEQLRLLPPEPPYQSANLWWPADRAWCVATEIDLNTTYIAGSQALIDALLECSELESTQVRPTDGVGYAADTLNPLPEDPYGSDFRLE